MINNEHLYILSYIIYSMQQELTVNDKEINICGIDFSKDNDVCFACIFNKSTNTLIKVINITENHTTKQEQEKIINDLIKTYNLNKVYY